MQGVLTDALSRVLDQDVKLLVAGRTDAGVHATGQVCHTDVEHPPAPQALAHRVNSMLDKAVRVLDVSVAPPGFDARYSALSRTYRYRVSDASYGAMPLSRFDTVVHPRPLSLTRLRAEAKPLTGLHDFAAFCRKREGATTIRTLRRLSWVREPDGVLVATLEADAFCHQMVRSLIGSLLLAGDGRRPRGFVQEYLAGRDRTHGSVVAPAHGLTLVAVRYPHPSRLARQSEITRARRQLPSVEAAG